MDIFLVPEWIYFYFMHTTGFWKGSMAVTKPTILIGCTYFKELQNNIVTDENCYGVTVLVE